MSFVKTLGIYEDAIEHIQQICADALQEAGVSDNDVDALFEGIEDDFRNGRLDYSDITNSLIGAMLRQTTEILQERLPRAEVTYYANCHDSHLYINGENYAKAYSNETGIIESLLDENCLDIEYIEGVSNGIAIDFTIHDDDIYMDILTAVSGDVGEDELTAEEQLEILLGMNPEEFPSCDEVLKAFNAHLSGSQYPKVYATVQLQISKDGDDTLFVAVGKGGDEHIFKGKVKDLEAADAFKTGIEHSFGVISDAYIGSETECTKEFANACISAFMTHGSKEKTAQAPDR